MLSQQLLAEWDYTKNTLQPEKITTSSGKKAWWKCSKVPHHSWESVIANRSKGSGCPICKSLLICPLDQCNSLKMLCPDIAKDWSERNEKGPECYSRTSAQKVWWKCDKEHHIYEMSINNRVLKGRNCAVCGHRQVCPIDQCNSLAKNCPDLVKEWDPTNERGPETYLSHSNDKVKWVCQKNKNHKWEAAICNRNAKSARGCPFCSNKKITAELDNSLKTLQPDLCQEWDNNKNEKGPECYTLNSGYNAWWQCPKRACHNYQTTIDKRVSCNYGCPFCSHQRLCKIDGCNSLQEKYPKIAKEWHPTKNDWSAKEHIAGGNVKVWWQCSKNPKHEWQASPAARIALGTNCPLCNRSKLELAFVDWAEANGVEFNEEHRIKDFKHKKKLPYDFLIKDTILIELDGRQHFDKTSYYAEKSDFKENIYKDILKTWYAVKNGYRLIRLSHLDADNFVDFLNELLTDNETPGLYYIEHPDTLVQQVYNIHAKVHAETTDAELDVYYKQILDILL